MRLALRSPYCSHPQGGPFLFFAALQLALILGRGQQEGRAWNRLERAALANGWVRPTERG